MSAGDFLFLFLIILFAFIILYRAIKKKGWCPDIYGTGACTINDQKKREKKRRNSD